MVKQNLDLETVQAAKAESERAFRSRDHAFLMLSRIHLLHHEVTGCRCRCGLTWERREIAAIVDSSKALKNWEHKQSERRRLGRDHVLPPNHPGVVDARWDPNEATPESDDF